MIIDIIVLLFLVLTWLFKNSCNISHQGSSCELPLAIS